MYISHWALWWLVILMPLLLLANPQVHPQKPLCDLYEDTFGSWKNTSDIIDSPHMMEKLKTHFVNGDVGYALNFSQVWVPHNCAYHRFTNRTVYESVMYLLKKKKSHHPYLQLIFIGDSALRGAICGLARILQGNELYGPVENIVCGGHDDNVFGDPRSYPFAHIPVDIDYYHGNLKITFIYAKKFYYNHLDWVVESAISITQPYAVIFNTGIWEFDMQARAHMDSIASENCSTPEQWEIAKSRSNNWIASIMREYGGLATKFQVRAIYRNSHFNRRFGAYCADELLEALLVNTGWEIWDNRRISHDVWLQQCYDGFHFDRYAVYNEIDHAHNRTYYHAKHGVYPGQLEMQLTHSLLFSLFHEVLQEAPELFTQP